MLGTLEKGIIENGYNAQTERKKVKIKNNNNNAQACYGGLRCTFSGYTEY